jgi:hypothetical protein
MRLINRLVPAVLLAALFAVPAAHSREPVKMTAALKARLDAIGKAEISDLKPLQDKEHELYKKRNDLVAAKVRAYRRAKSKPEAKASSAEFKEDAKRMSKEISSDPEIASLEKGIKDVRKEMIDKRAGFQAQREAAAKAP